MVKRKLRSQSGADSENESNKPAKQLKEQDKSSEGDCNVSSPLKEECDDKADSDSSLLGDCDGLTDDSQYESFSSFLRAFSFDAEAGDERHSFNCTSQSASFEHANSTNNERIRPQRLDLNRTSSSQRRMLMEDFDPNIRILSVLSKLSQVVSLQHPASLTLHGYVKVTVQLGSISVFGYKLKEGENINVFSTEGTGLKKAVTLKSMHKSTLERFAKMLRKMCCNEKEDDVEEFLDNIGPNTVVLIVEKTLLPPPLQFLQLYYPDIFHSKLMSERKRLQRVGERLNELCSTQKSDVIDISEHFEILSEGVSKTITEAENKGSGTRIFVLGEKNTGKSTLIRYLMNSCLTKHPVLYFLDADPGQTEYTPAGVVSLVKVTKPLLGPPFAHQKKPLKMIFIGSVTASTCLQLYQDSVTRLVKYFNDNFPKQTLFVNTMGWLQGLGAVCSEEMKTIVKPTMLIELTSPESNISFSRGIVGNDAILFRVPSISSKNLATQYRSSELRNFSLVAYLGQCQKSYMPATHINSFQPYCISWDKIALYVMDRKLPSHRLVEAIHCSIVALCHVNLSYMLKSDKPEFPMTLRDDFVCECLGFGLVRASDETNRLFYIVTPLTLDQLKNVNALIKGNVTIPPELFLKQNVRNVPLPFTDTSKMSKTFGFKPFRKRVFRRTYPPAQPT